MPIGKNNDVKFSRYVNSRSVSTQEKIKSVMLTEVEIMPFAIPVKKTGITKLNVKTYYESLKGIQREIHRCNYHLARVRDHFDVFRLKRKRMKLIAIAKDMSKILKRYKIFLTRT